MRFWATQPLSLLHCNILLRQNHDTRPESDVKALKASAQKIRKKQSPIPTLPTYIKYREAKIFSASQITLIDRLFFRVKAGARQHSYGQCQIPLSHCAARIDQADTVGSHLLQINHKIKNNQGCYSLFIDNMAIKIPICK